MDRRLLLLDEANASLDEATEAIMDEAVAAFSTGIVPGPDRGCCRRTLLVVAHRLAGVMSLDQVGENREGSMDRTLLSAIIWPYTAYN